MIIAWLFAHAVLYTVIGAFSGWVLGLTPLGGMIIEGFGYFGVKIDSLVNLGAALGFISAFFSNSSIKGEKP